MPREFPLTLELCAATGEGFFVSNNGSIAVDLHNHTNRSDGRDSMEMLATYAERHGVNLAVTDHNIPPEPKHNRMPPGLIAGMEVTTREGVDVVVIGTLAQVQQLFDSSVRPALHRRDPRFSPTALALTDLLDATRGGAYCLHPHYATTDGLSRLPPLAQADALQRSAEHGFVEINATRTADQNSLAQALALEWQLPTVTVSDAHREEWQHIGSYTEVPRSYVAAGEEPLIQRLMAALHRGDHVQHTLAQLSMLDRIRTGLQVGWSNSLPCLMRLASGEIARMVGRMPAAAMSTLPRRSREHRLPVAA